MGFLFNLLDIEDVKAIAKWPMTIDGDDIDMSFYFKSYERGDNPIKGPAKCIGYVVKDADGKRIGLFEYYKKGKDFEIGLALAPDMRSKKLGVTFVNEGIDLGLTLFPMAKKVLLEVDKTNAAAIRVYQNAGFEITSDKGDSFKMVRTIKKD